MKAAKQSAGILLYRVKNTEAEYFLVHPGGPFWAKKDIGAWSIPKGEFTNEAPLEAATREFEEETGISLDLKDFIKLNPVKLKSGKTIYAWGTKGDVDETKVKSNTFQMEWPPKSGKFIDVEEIDKAGWFTKAEALAKINSGQADLIIQLAAVLKP